MKNLAIALAVAATLVGLAGCKHHHPGHHDDGPRGRGAEYGPRGDHSPRGVHVAPKGPKGGEKPPAPQAPRH